MTPQRPPDGQARRSSLLLGAGPGAIVDLVEDAAIVGGLDAWRYKRDQDGFISEPRLADQAQALLANMPWWTHGAVRLRLPPDCSGDATPGVGIAVGRFPRWFLCQNPECRSIVNLKGLQKPAMRRHECSSNPPKGKKTPSPVVPIRFVSACIRGHIQEIEWEWFVHRERHGAEMGGRPSWCDRDAAMSKGDPLGEDWNTNLHLKQTGTTGDLSDFIVACRRCGRQRGLQDLAQKGILGPCNGGRPWLGSSAWETCPETARLLTRTASNAYFANAISVLSIPDPALELRRAVETVWDFVKVANASTIAVFRGLPQVADALEGHADVDVVAEIARRQRGLPVATSPIREVEWRAIMVAPTEVPGERPGPDEGWWARRLAVELPSFLERIVLVHHLTEVRTQLGFTRIEPIAGNAEGDYALDVHVAPQSLHMDWLPAVQILGEGVFLAFDAAAIDRWAGRPEVRRRADQFAKGFVALNATRVKPIEFTGVRLVMLHTIAHLLINSIALECGYAASSIRERLYCATTLGTDGVERTTRAGILLYTGSPGSEGTLGGLVEVGRNVLHHLKRAAELALLCSNDPVCARHAPDDPEGRFREGAACHGCVLIGEPSCERMNQDLDRTLVVPTVGRAPEAAFLGDWIRSWS